MRRWGGHVGPVISTIAWLTAFRAGCAWGAPVSTIDVFCAPECGITGAPGSCLGGDEQLCCVPGATCTAEVCAAPDCGTVSLAEGCACDPSGPNQCVDDLECATEGPLQNTCQVRLHIIISRAI